RTRFLRSRFAPRRCHAGWTPRDGVGYAKPRRCCVRLTIMRVVILGATGFIGRALVLALLGRGHRVTVLARSVEHARAVLPAGIDIRPISDDTAIAEADAVVNLAGESLAGKRWTKKRKHALVASRIESTRRLVESIAKRDRELPVFVSTSAVGWY